LNEPIVEIKEPEIQHSSVVPEESEIQPSLNEPIVEIKEPENQYIESVIKQEEPSLNEPIVEIKEPEIQPSLNEPIVEIKEPEIQLYLNEPIVEIKEPEIQLYLNEPIVEIKEPEEPSSVVPEEPEIQSSSVVPEEPENQYIESVIEQEEPSLNEPIFKEQENVNIEKSGEVAEGHDVGFLLYSGERPKEARKNIQFEIITQVETIDIDDLGYNVEKTEGLVKDHSVEFHLHPEERPEGAHMNDEYTPPKVIFIVPYRDREIEKEFFEKQMSVVMQDYPNKYYKIYYIQQNHDKPFNRGAMKNIGFLMVKNKYPETYKNITLVFNDVDTSPVNKTIIPDYSTTPGTIKHFYGYYHVLGGIVSITAGDFERLNGYPNYYSWGFEDNELKERANKSNITIDRSVFYQIKDDKNIIQLKQSPTKIVNSGDFDRYIRRVNEGINTIYDLHYIIDEETGIVDVKTFKTKHDVDISLNREYDTSKNNYPFITGYSAKKRCKMNMVL